MSFATHPSRVLLASTLVLGCAGCGQLGAQLAVALITLPIRAALHEAIDSKPGYSGTVPPANFSDCELARGRWREAHQEAGDDLPPEYQCGPAGEWPPGYVPPPPPPPPPPPTPPPPSAVARPLPSIEGIRVYDFRNPGVEITPQ